MANLLGIGASLVGGVLGRKSRRREARAIGEGRERAVEGLAPFAEAGAEAEGIISGALGQEGAAGQEGAFQNFLASTGFKSQLKAGTEAITGSRAARGLLQSGSTLKRLTSFGQELAQGGFQNFLQNLSGQAGRGLQAAGGTANIITDTTRREAGARREGAEAFQSGVGAAFTGVRDIIDRG